MCGTHNRLLGEQEYGRAHVAAAIATKLVTRPVVDSAPARRVNDAGGTPPADVCADAISALVNLDFKPALARRAVLAAAAELGANLSFQQLILLSLRHTRAAGHMAR